jgi:spore coat protein H
MRTRNSNGRRRAATGWTGLWALGECVRLLAGPAEPGQAAAGGCLFESQPVWRIEIELAPQNLERLRIESRKYVPAIVRVFDEVFRDAGVHLKGRGSFRPIDDKPDFTVDFSKFASGGESRGLEKIHLNNSVQDPTYLKEQIAGELFQAAGLPAQRVAHALVRLNGRPLGLYVVKEGFTRGFLGRHFERPDGNLYDTDEGHDVDEPLKRHLSRDAAADRSELKRLAAAAVEPDLVRRWERLGRTLDVDRFLTFMAMELMICHWDGYCLGRNNFRVYQDPRFDRIVFLPGGMDQVFSKADMPWKPDMAGLVARAVMETPEGRQQYAARFRKLYGDLFVSERITNRVNQLLAALRPCLDAAEFRQLERETAELNLRIVARERSLRTQLNEPDPSFPDFQGDIAALGGWKAFDEPVGGTLRGGPCPDGREVLRIVAGARTSASWRTTVKLKRGQYRFQGRARAVGVAALPFGNSQGASLRVAGKAHRSAELLETTGWETLQHRFEVSAPEEDVVLICQLRAAVGEAWFEKNSLSLARER